jgi:hypothetical protein
MIIAPQRAGGGKLKVITQRLNSDAHVAIRPKWTENALCAAVRRLGGARRNHKRSAVWAMPQKVRLTSLHFHPGLQVPALCAAGLRSMGQLYSLIASQNTVLSVLAGFN